MGSQVEGQRLTRSNNAFQPTPLPPLRAAGVRGELSTHNTNEPAELQLLNCLIAGIMAKRFRDARAEGYPLASFRHRGRGGSATAETEKTATPYFENIEIGTILPF